jgi:hypothetical protein
LEEKMGFLSKLFGSNNAHHSNPKNDIIKKYIKKKIYGDPSAPLTISDVDSMPEEILMGLPEATLFWIVENYWLHKKQNFDDNYTFQAIEDHRSNMTGEAGILPAPLNLENYVKYRVKIEHQEGSPNEKLIEEAIKEISSLLN